MRRKHAARGRHFGKLGLLLATLHLMAAASPGAADESATAASIPKIKALPDTLPTAKIKEDGPMQPVRSAAEALEKSVTKACAKCGGSGQVTVGKTKGEFGKPIRRPCKPCRGEGKVPNTPDAVQRAALSLVATIVRLSPDTQGADLALTKAYDAVTECVIKDATYYQAVQAGSAGVLSQTKPVVGSMVMAKCLFGYEMDHPAAAGKKVFVFRIAHKKQLVAVVAPKQSDTPQPGGRALIAGVVTGAVAVGTDEQANANLIVVERGFMLAPNVDARWWNAE